ncbi:uncharacterized protein METZ01_LOCUS200677, partial [marine metagenome]
MKGTEIVQSSIQANKIDQFKRPHRMIEPELQRFIDIFGRSDPFLQHSERFIPDQGIHSTRNKAGRLVHKDRLFPHRSRDLFGPRDRLLTRLASLDNFDQFHDMDRIKEVHSDHPFRLLHPIRNLCNRNRTRIRSENRMIRSV